MSDPNTFTVGWICAIPTESIAARQFLDEEFDLPTHVSPNDNNAYTVGRMGQHRVVVAVLPDGEYGTTSAATVARDMVHSFPNIRIGLMVGIGGGAPSKKHDIRLGDVVVSSPRDGQAGIVQYDFGKLIQGQGFHHTGLLNQPQLALRTAVNALRDRYSSDGHQIHENIQAILAKKKRLQRSHQRPNLSTDRLYPPTFIHQDSNRSCDEICIGDEACDVVPPETRDERKDDDDNPAIHYGLIASSNKLMKDANIRDSFANEHGVLCFEMEAAGLMNHFPCLVIRGICDYSDTHKNKAWQGYAAMTAAAYAKDLLGRMIPTKIEAEKRLSETLSSISQEIKQDRAINLQSKIHTWLCPPDPSTNYHKALAQRHQGSGQWFITSSTYSAWKEGRNRTLWIRGIPGCGKTILSSTIIEDLAEGDGSQKPLYFYFDFSDVGKQTFANMVKSLILQFSHINTAAEAESQTLHKQHQNGTQEPSMHALEQTLRKMVLASPQTPIVLDALDECTARENLLKWLRDIPCRVLLTSRGLEDISRALRGWLDRSCIVDAQGNEVDDDIAAYVQHKLRGPNSTLAETWQPRPDILEKIETRIKGQANGMFRWAACQLQALEAFEMPNDLLKALESLPKTLSETYKRILDNIPESDLEHSRRILSFLTYSEKPLRILEVVDFLAVSFHETPKFCPNYRMPRPDRVLKFCSSLVTLTKDDHRIRLAHFSVKEYLTSDADKGLFSHALNPPMAHESITEVLMAYFSSLTFDKDEKSLCSEAGLPLENQQKYPLLEYGATHWWSHAKYVPETRKSTHQRINEFLSNRKAWNIVQGLKDQHLHYWLPFESEHRNLFPEEDLPVRDTPTKPLYIACLGGLSHAVQYLLEQGADVNRDGGILGRPLQAACSEGHSEVAKLLIQWGAKVDIQDQIYKSTVTALMPAIVSGMTDVVKLLLERGANPNLASAPILNKWGVPPYFSQDLRPLTAASRVGSVEIVGALLGHGADVQFAECEGGTALMNACFGGHTAVAKLLIDSGAIIDFVAENFEASSIINFRKYIKCCTALMLASYANHMETVNLLIQKGADVDRSGGHDTALTVARSRGHEAVVQTLLKHGATEDPTERVEDSRPLSEDPVI